MDRRVEKTRKAINDAFYNLICNNNYSKISIQDIIDEANVGRSTFYDHYETKDELLKEMISNIFEHIFNKEISKETNCDINSNTLKEKIVHIMYHLKEKKDAIKSLIMGDAENTFIYYFKRYIDRVSLDLKNNYNNIPNEFIKHHITSSIIEMIKYWIQDDFKEDPGVLVDYYLKLLPNDIFK